MHISEGVLSAQVLLSGAALGAGGVAVGLKKMDYARMPMVAVLTAAFFVASLVRVPVGPASLHLVLNGLLGLLLGWMSFPAIFVALALQAVLFQFGGITTLGVNTVNMAAPALVAYYLSRPLLRSGRRGPAAAAGFAAGFSGVALGSGLIALSLLGTGQEFRDIARFAVAANVPLMAVEGVVTAFIVLFLRRVKPEMLEVGR